MCMGEGETGSVKQIANLAMSYLCPVAEDLPISSISDELLRKLKKAIQHKGKHFSQTFYCISELFLSSQSQICPRGYCIKTLSVLEIRK